MRLPHLVLALLAVVAAGCDGADPEPPDPGPPTDLAFVSALDVVVNPSGFAPLAAEVTLATTRPVRVAVAVEGRGGAGTEIRHAFLDLGTAHTIPVLGLYPGSSTAVTLAFTDAGGADLGSTVLQVQGQALRPRFPAIAINAIDAAAVTPGMTLVSYFGHDGIMNPQSAFAFDQAGAIRWALDFTGHPVLGNLFYDNGIERLANGNLYFGDGATNRIYEVDMLGRVVQTWGMPGYGFHHHVLEKPNGDFLVTVNRQGTATIEDVVIQIDRQTGRIENEWDLRQSLDPDRRAWPTDLTDLAVDWCHINAVDYDPATDGLLVSCRTQGLVKLTASNEVVWILAPHRGWAMAGDGTDLSTKLLQPLDAAGDPITDPAVLDGLVAHPDFEWAWYQHAPKVLPDGSFLLFDNGDNRFYRQPGTYSRAVQFRVDEAARTVRQVWQYGRERGTATYSRIVSDVDYLEATGHVVFAPGAVAAVPPYGKMVEVDRATGAVVFEATIRPPIAPFGITFHRVERLPLYPEPEVLAAGRWRRPAAQSAL